MESHSVLWFFFSVIFFGDLEWLHFTINSVPARSSQVSWNVLRVSRHFSCDSQHGCFEYSSHWIHSDITSEGETIQAGRIGVHGRTPRKKQCSLYGRFLPNTQESHGWSLLMTWKYQNVLKYINIIVLFLIEYPPFSMFGFLVRIFQVYNLQGFSFHLLYMLLSKVHFDRYSNCGFLNGNVWNKALGVGA